MTGRHGSDIRGSNQVPSSNLPVGRFGRMFRELPPAIHSETVLKALAETMLVDGPAEDNSIVSNDGQENFDIPAGYTYLGQFIDHDLTLDTQSSLERANDPNALVDFRTPRFDLDSIYGRGPDDQPYMYQNKFNREPDGQLSPDQFNGVKLLEGVAGDLPRSADERAIIGDPRNDENRIISQLQQVFIKFHNRAAEILAKPELQGGKLFAAAQRETRWHYQWVVVHDFLERIAGKEVVDAILDIQDYVAGGQTELPKATLPGFKLEFYHWENEPFIPVEFSGAVYRFGHSMVRPSYHLNMEELGLRDPLGERKDEDTEPFRVPIFAKKEPNLNGFRPLTPKAEDWPDGVKPFSFQIDWRFFFEGLGDIEVTLNNGERQQFGPQPSYKIDTKVVEPLALLNVIGAVRPDPARPHFHSLAFRNLLRGIMLGIPSGQDVARKMGIVPLKDADIWRDAEVNDEDKELFESKGLAEPTTLREYVAAKLIIAYENERKADGALLNEDELKDKAEADVAKLERETPLWFYILQEGESQQAKKTNPEDEPGTSFGARLGPVGGRIVAEVFLGLLYGDNQAYLSLNPNWTPSKGKLGLPDELKMGEFVKFAIGE